MNFQDASFPSPLSSDDQGSLCKRSQRSTNHTRVYSPQGVLYFDANFKFGPIHSCGDPSLASFSSGFRVKRRWTHSVNNRSIKTQNKEKRRAILLDAEARFLLCEAQGVRPLQVSSPSSSCLSLLCVVRLLLETFFMNLTIRSCLIHQQETQHILKLTRRIPKWKPSNAAELAEKSCELSAGTQASLETRR